MAYVAKTQQTDADVAAYLAKVEPAARRADAEAICALMAEVSGQPPRMWGTSIVGFGKYRYRYASGHSGETCRMGFAARKSALTLYMAHPPDRDALLARLGKHSTGVGCLYIKKLADVDAGALKDLVAASWPSEALMGLVEFG